jgi:molecular chaperone GrpE (heat shock protein)
VSEKRVETATARAFLEAWTIESESYGADIIVLGKRVEDAPAGAPEQRRENPKHPITGEDYEAIHRQIGAEKKRLREKNQELHERTQRAEAELVKLRKVAEAAEKIAAGYYDGGCDNAVLAGLIEEMDRVAKAPKGGT